VADGPAICNTSPLVKLAGIGLLHLLPDLYGEVLVPEAVRTEFAAGATPSDPDIGALPWIRVHTVQVAPPLVGMRGLGPGEAEAISLALEHQARVILLDDKLARKTAASLGLPVAGTLAILLRAKRAQLIPAVQPIVDQMIAQGRHISHSLRNQLLADAGELDTLT
jgi:uncharacterized protein